MHCVTPWMSDCRGGDQVSDDKNRPSPQATDDAQRDSATGDLLEVRDLRTHIEMRRSRVVAVDGVSFSIRPGETLGLVGESGSGKTLTAMSIVRLLPPGGRIAGGSVRICGRDVTGLPDNEMRLVRGRDVGVVFQDPMTSLNPTMTIGDQIAEPVWTHTDASRKQALERAAEVLELVGMPRPAERLRAFPHQLSGGLRQRAMIAIALACSPRLLIADEPTTALDVTIQDQILSLLDELKTKLHMGMLLITHDMGVIAAHADRVNVMYAGQIAESADVSTIFSSMRHPYTQALLESIPDLTADKTRNLYTIPGIPPDSSRLPTGCRFAPRCRYVRQRCRDEDPALSGDEGSHAYACFFPVGKPAPRLDGTSGNGASGNGTGPAGSAAGREPEDADSASGPISKDTELAAASEAQPTGGHDVPGERENSILILDGVVREFPIVRGVLRRQVGSVKAVSDVSLTINAGETFGLVGESGCGKTTLGRLIVGLEKLDSGRIVFDGANIASRNRTIIRRRQREVQLMFQDPYASLDPRMRVRSILREPLDAQNIGTKQSRLGRIRKLLEDVGLPLRALGLYPHEFSGGQRQRIGLARALAVGPRLVVADEPVSALDVSIQAQILNLMKRLQRQHDLTYIIISHDLSVVRYLSDRVGVMYLGKLVEVGPVDEIYDRPAHPYTMGLLKAIPAPDPDREREKAEAAVRGELPSAAHPPSGCRFRTRCPQAQEICAREEPRLRSFNVTAHHAACHFPLQVPLAAATEA